MRTPVAALLVLAALHATAASARSPSISPLVGRWAVDVDSLSIPAHARPKSVVLEFRDGGKDRWTTQIEIVDPVLLQHFDQAMLGGFSGGDLGVDIADHLIGNARICPEEFEDLLIRLTGLDQLRGENAQPFLEDVKRFRRVAAADVGQVGGIRGKGDQLSFIEDRPHHIEVVQMPAANPRVVRG